MTKTKTILAVAFFLVFAAGAVVGTVRPHVLDFGRPHNPGGPGTEGRRDGGSFLTRELGLTPDQQHQMKDIWSAMPALGREHGERRREFQKQRDDAVVALLTPDQRAKYDAIQKDYSDRLAAMQQERQQAFQQAVEKTKSILTPDQAAKYETFLKQRRDTGGPGGGPPPWRDHDHHGAGGPATRHAD
jgi:Spy/CpxP family protein refolding chaperone